MAAALPRERQSDGFISMSEGAARRLIRDHITEIKKVGQAYEHAAQVAAMPDASEKAVHDAYDVASKIRRSRQYLDIFVEVGDLLYECDFAGESEIRSLIRMMFEEADGDPFVMLDLALTWREHIEPRFDIRTLEVLKSAARQDEAYRLLLETWSDPTIEHEPVTTDTRSNRRRRKDERKRRRSERNDH